MPKETPQGVKGSITEVSDHDLLQEYCRRQLGRRSTAIVDALRMTLIDQALHSCNGNLCAAARQLGMHRNTLLRYVQHYKVDRIKTYGRGWCARQGAA